MAITCRYYEHGHYRHMVSATHVVVRGFKEGPWQVRSADEGRFSAEFCLDCAAEVERQRNAAVRQAHEKSPQRKVLS